MFSGIIETTGIIEDIKVAGSNKTFKIGSDISKNAYIDQSITHNGVCLTVVGFDDHSHQVVAIEETLQKSNLSDLNIGDTVNLETSITVNKLLDGHIVQGHVDATGICTKVNEVDGSWYFSFSFHKSFANLLVSKGSISINGVSLTVIDPTEEIFTVAIIPYTFEHTNFKNIKLNDKVNLEFDIIGKYVARQLALRQ